MNLGERPEDGVENFQPATACASAARPLFRSFCVDLNRKLHELDVEMLRVFSLVTYSQLRNYLYWFCEILFAELLNC